jgi:putative FmdB family regulatory protein
MPLYEYRCRSCGQTVEVIQKFSDDPINICQSCGGSLERLLSAPAIQFKGTGWYITDYSRSNGKNGASKDEPVKKPETTAAAATAETAKPKAD